MGSSDGVRCQRGRLLVSLLIGAMVCSADEDSELHAARPPGNGDTWMPATPITTAGHGRRLAEKTPACRCDAAGCSCDFAAETDLEAMLAPLGYDTCLEEGDCERCTPLEARAAYCERTGSRQRVVCARCGHSGGPPLFCSYSEIQPIWTANLSSPAWLAHVQHGNASSRDGSAQSSAGLFFRSCGSSDDPTSGGKPDSSGGAHVRHFRERARAAVGEDARPARAKSEFQGAAEAAAATDDGVSGSFVDDVPGGGDPKDDDDSSVGEADEGDHNGGEIDRDYEAGEDPEDEAAPGAQWPMVETTAAANSSTSAVKATKGHVRLTASTPDETPEVLTFLLLNSIVLAAALYSLRRQQKSEMDKTMQGLYAKVGVEPPSAAAPASGQSTGRRGNTSAGASSSSGQGAARRGGGASGPDTVSSPRRVGQGVPSGLRLPKEPPTKAGDATAGAAAVAVPDTIGRSIESIATAVNRTSRAMELAMKGEGTTGAEQKTK